LTFIQVIVCVDTISLSLTILVGGTVLNLLLNPFFECLFKFLSMLLVVLADFFGKFIECVETVLGPSTWQEIDGALMSCQLVCLLGGLGEPRGLTTTMLYPFVGYNQKYYIK
jgi:hypothetical protein